MYDLYFEKSDYENASEVVNASLGELSSSLKSMASRISSYCSMARNVLTGEAYDTILNSLSVHSQVYSKIAATIDVMINNVVSANNGVINAIGPDFSYVSGKELEELEKELANVRALLNILNAHSQSTSNPTTPITNRNPMFKLSTALVSVTEAKSFQDLSIKKRYTQKNSISKKIEEIKNALAAAKTADSNGVDGLTDLNAIITNINDCFLEK